MLTKLLKYDFKSLVKVSLPVYLVALLLAVLTRGLNLLAKEVSIFSVPSGFISTLFVIVIIAIPIFTFVLTIIRFYQNLVKDEGYLMHTLPVSKNQLVLSKTISALTFLFISCLVSIIVLFAGVYGIWFDSGLFTFIGQFWDIIDHEFVILLIVLSVLGFIMQQVMFYASIALGQKHNSQKGVFSVIYGIVLYNVSQILGIIILLPLMLSPDYEKYSQMTMPPFEFMNGYLIASAILSVLLIIGFHFITIRTMDKKLNLE